MILKAKNIMMAGLMLGSLTLSAAEAPQYGPTKANAASPEGKAVVAKPTKTVKMGVDVNSVPKDQRGHRYMFKADWTVLQLGLFPYQLTSSRIPLYGFTFNLVVNVQQEVNGLSVSPLGLYSKELNGASIGMFNVVPLNRGLLLGAANYCNENYGVAVGLCNFVEKADAPFKFGGLQIGLWNEAENGAFQLGIYNKATKAIQIGIYNETDYGLQIGLLNYNRHAAVKFMPICNFSWEDDAVVEPAAASGENAAK